MTLTDTAPDLDLEVIDAIVAENGREQNAVIAILHAIQDRFNYLPEAALRRVSEITDISPATITGVATFYARFRLRPAGKHIIKVCTGTACHVMGAEALYDSLKRELRLAGDNDTDPEGLFTIEKVACLGCCMLAPALQIDETTYGHLDSQALPAVLTDFLSSREGAADAVDPAPGNGNTTGEVRSCLCSSCSASGAREVFAAVREQLQRFHIPAALKSVGCTGMAYQAPLVSVQLQDGRNYTYGRVRSGDVQSVLLHHFRPATAAGRRSALFARLLDRIIDRGDDAEPVTRYPVNTRFGPDSMYVGPQCRIATENSGEMDPLDLDAYLEQGGFQTLEQCLREWQPGEIIESVSASGLRGRGGGGFPTGKKWQIVAEQPEAQKYIVCNGDEGDPGAFMDRMLLESFPYRVIEGMLIAAFATGCRRGYFYIRAEYPLALKSIKQALRICGERGYLGMTIAGTVFDCHIETVSAAGAFVCGEETALIASIEGKRGMPSLRPPYPAQSGLWGKPTLVNNVETFATVPWIMRHGAKKFAELGTKTSKGTKTFALAGKIERSGLIEVPMGLTLRQIVDEIGGGIKGGGKLKAIQVGGPSGGCIPAWRADTPVDYEALTEAGSIMGSGGLVVLDDSDCMVDMARYFMAFTQNESCGKCTFCRIGTKRMLEILEGLCAGDGRKGDLEKLEQLAGSVQTGSICGLGKTAPNPVLSLMRHFRDEFEAHLEGRCPARHCKNLITYSIDESCIGCTICAQHCAFDAIEMVPFSVHVIDQTHCTKCDICRKVCPADSVRVQ